MPPPSSQSYFDQFPNYQPNATASFDDEFSRCMSLQNVVPGTQEYRTNRTKAISHELKFHYSQEPGETAVPSQSPDSELSDTVKLKIYQNMCREVGLKPRDTVDECVKDLKTKVLVNIPDFIDSRRTGQKVKVWNDFRAFRTYSLHPDHRIDVNAAKADGGFLAVLLRKLISLSLGKRKRTKAVKREH